MKLFLYHGRDDPNQTPEDWGYDGPTLDGVTFLVVTYFTHFRVGFKDAASFEKARAATGWEVWDDLQLLMKVHDDMVEAAGKFYGDWTLDEEQARG